MNYGFNDDKEKVEVYPASEVYTKNEVYSKSEVYNKNEVYSKSERVIFQVTMDNTVPANDRVSMDRNPADILTQAGLDPSEYNIDDFSLIATEYRFSTNDHWLQDQSNDAANSTTYFSWHGNYMFFALRNTSSESKRIIGRFTWMRTKP